MEPTEPVLASHDAATVRAANRESNAATATELFPHAAKSLVELVCPTCIRSEYRLIFSKLSRNRVACVLFGILLTFSVAECQQPGWFPRPDQLSSAALGFLGACTLMLLAFALFEYDDTHSWPWEDEGFVWPWEALLWSSTVYNDEAFDESTIACTRLHDVPTSHSQRAHVGVLVGDHGRASNVGTKSSSIPEASEEQDMFIPPTPFLPRGLRPAHLASPVRHRSGLMDPSPMPAKFQSMK